MWSTSRPPGSRTGERASLASSSGASTSTSSRTACATRTSTTTGCRIAGRISTGSTPATAGDALTDDDNDGLINRDEFFAGSLPFDPDTDDGGESDGSEVSAGRDPLYDQDDLLPPILDYGVVTHVFHQDIHEPKPETNILHFPVASTYQRMEIWRTTGAPTPFTLLTSVDLSVEMSGVHYDEGLTNGVTYDYYLVAEGLSGARTAPTDVFQWNAQGRSATAGCEHRAQQRLAGRGLAEPAGQARCERRHHRHAALGGLEHGRGPVRGLRDATAHRRGSRRPAPYTATVFTQVQDSGGNFSLIVGDSIVIDENGDADGDGAPNSTDLDDDGDGIPDLDEITIHGTDPMSADSDGDGLPDRDEIFVHLTSPLLFDTDGDGFSDSVGTGGGHGSQRCGFLSRDAPAELRRCERLPPADLRARQCRVRGAGARSMANAGRAPGPLTSARSPASAALARCPSPGGPGRAPRALRSRRR